MPLQGEAVRGGQMGHVRAPGYGTVMRAEARAPLRLMPPINQGSGRALRRNDAFPSPQGRGSKGEGERGVILEARVNFSRLFPLTPTLSLGEREKHLAALVSGDAAVMVHCRSKINGT